MTRHEREQCVKRMLQGEVWVLVTTDVLARGMDFGGVHGVINFDWPESVQSYVHRIGVFQASPACNSFSRTRAGRTGRAGRQGTAITYFTDDDAPYLKSYVVRIGLGHMLTATAGLQMFFSSLDKRFPSG